MVPKYQDTLPRCPEYTGFTVVARVLGSSSRRLVVVVVTLSVIVIKKL